MKNIYFQLVINKPYGFINLNPFSLIIIVSLTFVEMIMS